MTSSTTAVRQAVAALFVGRTCRLSEGDERRDA